MIHIILSHFPIHVQANFSGSNSPSSGGDQNSTASPGRYSPPPGSVHPNERHLSRSGSKISAGEGEFIPEELNSLNVRYRVFLIARNIFAIHICSFCFDSV